MKINLKARLNNRVFVLSASALIVTFIYQVLSIFNVVVPVSESEASELVGLFVNILAFFGVLVDPTTQGLSDSQRAMTYCTQWDVRSTEEVENE